MAESQAGASASDALLTRRTVLGAVIAPCLLAACGRSAKQALPATTTSVPPTLPTTAAALPTTTTAATTTTVAPASLVVMHDSGVTDAEVDLITRILTLAQAELGSTGPLTAFAYNDLDELLVSGAFRGFSPAGLEQQRTIITNGNVSQAGGGRGVMIYLPNFRRQQDKEKIVIHEYYHELQAFLRGSALSQPDIGVPAAGPSWLLEGSAEYFGYQVASAHGLSSFSVARQRAVQASRVLGPLPTYENLLALNAAVSQGSFPFGALATEFMVSRYAEDRVRIEFWRNERQAGDWPKAFLTTFGEPIEAFYGAFEDFRSTLR